MQKTKGQVEDTLAKAFSKFYAGIVGVGPKQTKVYIVEDMIVVRLWTKLLPFEKTLLENQNRGVDLVKNIRQLLHENSIQAISEVIFKETGVKVVSFHSDVSTRSEQILQIYILESALEKQLLVR